MAKNKFLRILSFFIFPVCVFIFSNLIGRFFDAYLIYPWIDMPVHFLGGISIAYTAYLFMRYFKEEGFVGINRKFLHVLFIVSLVALVSILWEFYEFLMFNLFGIIMQPSLKDTMGDFLYGLLGGLAGALIFVKSE